MIELSSVSCYMMIFKDPLSNIHKILPIRYVLHKLPCGVFQYWLTPHAYTKEKGQASSDHPGGYDVESKERSDNESTCNLESSVAIGVT
jgi:hypothetical protein